MALGPSDIYPLAYKANHTNWYAMASPSAQQVQNPLKMLIGPFDLAFVVTYLLPLFIAALCYDLLASEKESGVLGLVLAQPVSLRTLLLAKMAVRMILTFVMVPIYLTACVLVVGLEWRTPDTSVKFLIWLLTATLYGCFWFGLALLVNARGKSSGSNGVILAVCWFGLCVLVPAASAFAAKAIYPIHPSRAELMNARRVAMMSYGPGKFYKELDNEASLLSRLVKRLLTENPDLQMADIPLPGQKFRFVPLPQVINQSPQWRVRLTEQKSPLIVNAYAAETDRRMEALQSVFRRQYDGQHRLMEGLNALSPALLVQSVVTTLGGTSQGQHDRFMAQVEAHRREWDRYFLRRSLGVKLIGPSDYDQCPYPRYEPEPLNSILSCIKNPLTILMCLTIVVRALGKSAFRRFPISQ